MTGWAHETALRLYSCEPGIRNAVIGVTSDLIARLWQHRAGEVKGFTSKYRVYRLVRFELSEDMHSAISREKQLKRWHRQWKINLIESENPQWADLAPSLGLPPLPSC